MKKAILVYLFITISLSYLSQSSLIDDIEIQTLNGVSLPLKDVLKGKKDKPVILYTWSKKWCAPCVSTLDYFQKNYYKELKENSGLTFIALNLDGEDKVEEDEIKEFVIEKGWLFDVYQDPKGNYMNALNITSAPKIYLFVNNTLISSKSGFIDMKSSYKNARYLFELVESIGKRKIYFDKDWNFCNESDATFVRYVDKIADGYEVHDRWVTGELQMKGVYKDKYLAEKNGEFIYYHKNGNKESQKIYVNNELEGVSKSWSEDGIQTQLWNYKNGKAHGERKQWYESGKLWVREEYKDGLLMNINELYDSKGKALYKGTLKDGTGDFYRYDVNGKKTSKFTSVNGLYNGYIYYYNTDGTTKNKYKFEMGKYIEED